MAEKSQAKQSRKEANGKTNGSKGYVNNHNNRGKHITSHQKRRRRLVVFRR